LSDLVWKDGARTAPARAQILRNLSRIGIAPDIANMIVNRLPPITDRKQLWRAPLTSLAQLIPVVDDPLVKQGGVAALIGPTGVGKTTTIAKIAARYAMSYGSDEIALISADAYRIGAREHLTAFGNIIGVSVQSAANSAELGDLLDRFSNKKLVLIDTEGTSQRDRALSDRLAAYGDNADRVKFYLTLSAANQESGLDETIRKFSSVPLAGSIITKVDEAGQLGCILSALVRHDLKAAYLSDGQRVPDDLYKANKKKLWLVNQAVDCVRNSAPVVDERIMAESFGHVSAAHG
jgi:flagellar biosynthesis protein FlhF